MILKITDGTTEVILHNDGGSPSVGLAGARYIPTEGSGDTVTETIEQVFTGSTTNMLTQMNRVRRLLAQAAEAQVDPGVPKVYVHYDVYTGDLWRSELVSGQLVWSTDRHMRQLQETSTLGEMAIVITRLNYWEKPTTETLFETGSIYNGPTSPYNAITMTAPSGDQPTPIKVEIENFNADLSARNFYLTMDSFSGLTTNQHLLTSGAGAASWSSAPDHDTLLWTLAIPSAVIGKLAGMSVNVVAGFTSLPANIYIRATLYNLIAGSLYVPLDNGGEKFTADRKLHNLGTVQFPKLANGNLVMAISLYSTAASGSATLSFVQITPARRALHLRLDDDWADGDLVTYDGENDVAYYDNGVSWDSTVSAEGGPLLAWPGRTNRLFILFDEAASFSGSRQMIVAISARPRRKTL